MSTIDLAILESFRKDTFHTSGARLVDPSQALDFVNERGFCFFWPVKGVLLPSLWVATAGDRPVPDAHDDPGHVTWGWKDGALGKRIWYYGKILRRKATFISNEIAPYFYVLSENYGSPEEDYLLSYHEGRLTQAAKQVYETLLEKGSLDTLMLRKEAHLLNAKESLFNRALEDLQKDFKILPIGIAEVGAWRYAFRYEVVPRHLPDLPEKSRPIGEGEARRKLVELFFRSVGAAQLRDVTRLFGWQPELTRRPIEQLVRDGVLVKDLTHPQVKGEWIALTNLVS